MGLLLFSPPKEHIVMKVASFVIGLAMYLSFPITSYRILICAGVLIALLERDPEKEHVPSFLVELVHSPMAIRMIAYPILLLVVGIITAGSLGYF